MPEQLNRSEPPRQLNLYSQLVLVFSGFNAVFGWFFFGFGMIFFWVFGMNSTAVNWFSFGGGSWEKAKGSVQAIHASSFEENEEEIIQDKNTYLPIYTHLPILPTYLYPPTHATYHTTYLPIRIHIYLIHPPVQYSVCLHNTTCYFS